MLQWKVLVVDNWGKGYMICSSDALCVAGRGSHWDDRRCLIRWWLVRRTRHERLFWYNHNDLYVASKGEE